MEDVLCFLNELDFVDNLDYDYLEKLVEVKRMMVREFKDYNISKMIFALNITDEIKLSDVTNDLDHRLERTEPLRSKIFYLIRFTHLVDTNEEHENNADDEHVIEH